MAQKSDIEWTDATWNPVTGCTFDGGREELARLLAAGPAEAYFCGDDLLAVGALSAIGEAGLSVPRVIGLIGLNAMEMAGWQNIALTTIRQPVAQIIGAAIDLIVATIETPDCSPQTRLFACELVQRGTLR